MFAKRIVRALMEQGHHVLLVCAAPQEVASYLEEIKLEGRRTRIWFEELGYSELATYASLLSHMRALYRKIRIWFEKFGCAGLVTFPSLVSHTRALLPSTRVWKHTADALQRIIVRSGLTPDLVFFCMADDYVNSRVSAAEIATLFPYAWSGLGIFPKWLQESPRHIPPCLLDSHCKGLFLLDETLVSAAQALIGKPCHAFPEVTDVSEPQEGRLSELVAAIECFRAGRYLVGLFGVVDRRKGIFHLLRIANFLRDSPIAFVIAGDVTAAETEIELDYFEKKLAASGLTNVFFRRGRIAEDEEFNALVKSVDLLWVAYPNFDYSSNQLTKAAYFGTPVAVNAGGLLAERVREFDLGIAIPTANESRSAELISEFLMKRELGSAKKPSQRYYSQHSPEQFDKVVSYIPRMGLS